MLLQLNMNEQKTAFPQAWIATAMEVEDSSALYIHL